MREYRMPWETRLGHQSPDLTARLESCDRESLVGKKSLWGGGQLWDLAIWTLTTENRNLGVQDEWSYLVISRCWALRTGLSFQLAVAVSCLYHCAENRVNNRRKGRRRRLEKFVPQITGDLGGHCWKTGLYSKWYGVKKKKGIQCLVTRSDYVS